MTIGYFPKLYPDEILGSAVARYRVHTMVMFDAHVNKELYGNAQLHTPFALPRGLKDLHRLIEPFLGLSLEEVVFRATLYPYYTAFTDRKIKARILTKMLQERQGQRGRNSIGGREPPIARIKACRNCISEDLAQFGESYWHRTHQLDCVHFCEKHALPLVEAVILPGFRKSICALTPQVLTHSYLPDLSERSRQRLFDVSRLARQYLDGSIIHDRAITRASPPKAFRDLYSFGCFLNITDIRRDIIQYFGEQCLEILGIPLNNEKKIDWIRDIFSSQWLPIKHVVTQLFNQDFAIPRCTHAKSRDYVEKIIKIQKWKCQNRAAPHFGQRIITDVHLTKDFRTSGGIVFKCTCGYQFFINSKNWNLHSEPTNAKVLEFGELFVRTVRELNLLGVQNAAIAKHLRVDQDLIRRMLCPSYRLRSSYNLMEDAQFAIRLQTVKKSLLQNCDLAEKLHDETIAKKIEDATRLIIEQTPLKRATAARILEAAKIDAECLFSEPYCSSSLFAIQNCIETAAAFRQRKSPPNL